MNLLSNSCQQTCKKSETEKTGAPTKPATVPPEKFLLLLRYNLFIGVDKMRVNNITVTVSVSVSVTVRVSLVFSGRELAFTIRYMLSQIRLSSVCLSSVCRL